jgi:hypothetical protein
MYGGLLSRRAICDYETRGDDESGGISRKAMRASTLRCKYPRAEHVALL